MRRKIALLLALAALFTLTACGGEGADTEDGAPVETPPRVVTGEEAEAGERLLSDWFDVLFAAEKCYENLQWTLSYVDAFLDAPAWDSLLEARASVAAAMEDAAARELPEAEASSADHDLLNGLGRNVGLVSAERGGWTAERDAILDTYRELRSALEDSVYWAENLERFSGYAEAGKKAAELRMDYYALATDGLLLRLDNAALAERFRSAVAESCPLLSARMDPGRTDAEAIDAEASTAALRRGELLSDMEARINEMEAENTGCARLYAGGDLEALAAGAAELEGLSAVLPRPDWDGAATVWYREAEDGAASAIVAGDSLPGPPDGCRIVWPRVARSELPAYVDAAAALGLDPLTEPDTEGGAVTVCYVLPDAGVVYRWVANSVTAYMIDGIVCLAPAWYAAVFSA